MDATKLNFKYGSFDLILFIDIIDHLNTKEQEKTIKAALKVLKKDRKKICGVV